MQRRPEGNWPVQSKVRLSRDTISVSQRLVLQYPGAGYQELNKPQAASYLNSQETQEKLRFAKALCLTQNTIGMSKVPDTIVSIPQNTQETPLTDLLPLSQKCRERFRMFPKPSHQTSSLLAGTGGAEHCCCWEELFKHTLNRIHREEVCVS